MDFLDLLNETNLKLIKYKTYKGNQVIFNEGDICTELLIIKDGEATINTYTYKEKEETLTVLHPGNLAGQFLLFTENPYYLGTCITTKATTIAYINKENLLNIFSNNQKALEYYLKEVCTESVKVKEQTKLLAHKNIRDRIMYYITHNRKNNVCYIDSVTNLAFSLSLPRPSVSRELSKMEKEKLIIKDGNCIYINKK